MEKTIENIIYVELTPDPHIAANCPCQENGPYIFYRNEVLVRDELERKGKVSFGCENCNASYEISRKQVHEARVKQPINHAARKDYA